VIRSTLKRLARRILRRESPTPTTPHASPPTPVRAASPNPAPAASSPDDGEEKPWYLDGSEESYGWENTNAKDDVDTKKESS
jgi:hypothetical protein